MKGVCESYHLRTREQSDGVALLETAGLHGFVFPPKGKWVMILAEGELFSPNLELVSNNSHLVLIHIIYAERHGWSCEFYLGPHKAATLQQSKNRRDEPEVSAGFVQSVSEMLSLQAEQHAELGCIATDVIQVRGGELAMSRFAQAIELAEDYQLDSYEQVAAEFVERPGEFPGVREVLPDRNNARKDFPLVESKEHLEILFPRALFGNQSKTRSAIRKMVKQAWIQGSWRKVLEKVDLVHLSEIKEEIYIGACSLELSSRKQAWRTYDLNRALLDICVRPPAPVTPEEKKQRYRDLLLDGMNYLWFALGLLDRDLLNLDCGRDRKSCERACREMLPAYVRWLPEMLALAPLLRNSSSFNSYNREVWSGNISKVAAISGWNYDYERSLNEFQGSDIDYLLFDKVIEKDGDRYRVSPAFLPPT